MTNTAAFITGQSSAVDVTNAWVCEKGHVYSSWACLGVVLMGYFTGSKVTVSTSWNSTGSALTHSHCVTMPFVVRNAMAFRLEAAVQVQLTLDGYLILPEPQWSRRASQGILGPYSAEWGRGNTSHRLQVFLYTGWCSGRMKDSQYLSALL